MTRAQRRRSPGSSRTGSSRSRAAIDIPDLLLLCSFHDAGLLDELIVQIGSVTLGQGKPLLPRRVTFPPLRLVSARALPPGFSELRYEVQRTGGA